MFIRITSVDLYRSSILFLQKQRKMGLEVSKHDLELAKDQAIGIEAHIVHPHESAIHRACQHIHFTEGFFWADVERNVEVLKVQEVSVMLEELPMVSQLEADSVVDTCDTDYNECLTHFEQHRIDKASKLSKDLLDHYEANDICKDRLEALRKIDGEQKLVDFYYETIHGDGWVFKGEKEGIRVSSRHEGSSIGVLVESPLSVPIEIFVAVVTQIDLFCKFVPFMEYSKEEKTVARNMKIGHTINNIPIISKREAFFLGVGYDRLEYNNTVLLYTRSFTDNLELQRELDYKVHKTPGAVQLDYKYFVIEYTPSTVTKGWIKAALNIDMKLKGVPMFLLDFGCRNFGFDFISNILKIAKKFNGSEWQKRVESDPSLFNFFRGRLVEHLNSVGPKRIAEIEQRNRITKAT